MKPKLLASFSGGRTSGVMTKWLLDNKADEYDIKVVFANTGQEHERTLDFVHQCDREFGFGLTWVEADVDPRPGVGTAHRVVRYSTASRNGEPFEAVIRKYGIPNKKWPHCTRETKLNPIKSYLRSIGWDDYYTAIGIRMDERRRVQETGGRIIYPLIDWHPMDKQDVNAWWEEQSFNLDLYPHQGNCTWCWKKSLGKHIALIGESPEIFDFPRRMEREYGMAGAAPEGQQRIKRVFFRGNRSTDDLFALRAELAGPLGPLSQIPLDFDADAGCSESCEVFDTEAKAA